MADKEQPKDTPWGAVVRYIREEVLGMMRPEFGKLAGVSDVSVYKWETGRVEEPSGQAVASIFEGLVERGIEWIELSDLMYPDLSKLDAKKRFIDYSSRFQDAADAVRERSPNVSARSKIWAFLEMLDDYGATDDEIVEAFPELKAATLLRKRRELSKDGTIIDTGDTRGGSAVWQNTEVYYDREAS